MARSIPARLVLLVLLCCVPAARAVDWPDYPGKIDMGGWRIARNSANRAEVVLLGPPGGRVIVGSAAAPMVGYLFTPDSIFVQTRAGSADQYYVIQRDWPTSSHLGDQRIV